MFEALLKHIPAPHGDPQHSLQIQISSIQYNDYVGRIGVGRIYNGAIKTGQQVTVVQRDGTQIKSKVQQVQVFDGLGRKDVERVEAGDIVALVGIGDGGHRRQHLRPPPTRSRWWPRRSSRRH